MAFSSSFFFLFFFFGGGGGGGRGGYFAHNNLFHPSFEVLFFLNNKRLGSYFFLLDELFCVVDFYLPYSHNQCNI